MPVFIEDQAAYEKAINRRIAVNRRIGGERRFRAAFEDAQVLIDFVEKRVSHEQIAHFERHGKSMENASFVDACWAGLQIFGGLTEKQALAVRNILAKNVERAAEYRAEALTKTHVGIVGERRDFSLTVKFTTSYFGPFGTTYVYVCADPDGNVIVYKGSATIGKNGEAIKVKATIKEHGIRDGVCQTIIGRPKKI